MDIFWKIKIKVKFVVFSQALSHFVKLVKIAWCTSSLNAEICIFFFIHLIPENIKSTTEEFSLIFCLLCWFSGTCRYNYNPVQSFAKWIHWKHKTSVTDMHFLLVLVCCKWIAMTEVWILGRNILDENKQTNKQKSSWQLIYQIASQANTDSFWFYQPVFWTMCIIQFYTW